jgi:hypothetical protein
LPASDIGLHWFAGKITALFLGCAPLMPKVGFGSRSNEGENYEAQNLCRR